MSEETIKFKKNKMVITNDKKEVLINQEFLTAFGIIYAEEGIRTFGSGFITQEVLEDIKERFPKLIAELESKI